MAVSEAEMKILRSDFDALADSDGYVPHSKIPALVSSLLSRDCTPAEEQIFLRWLTTPGLSYRHFGVAFEDLMTHGLALGPQPHVSADYLRHKKVNLEHAKSKEGYFKPITDEKSIAELQGYVPQVTSELQKKGMWVGVAPEDVTVNGFREGIGSLTPPEGQAVVLKLLRNPSRAEIMVDCGQALSDAGVGVPLLVRGPNFIVEELALGDLCLIQSPEDIKVMAELAARLHQAPTDWFTSRHRELLEEALPVLREEPPTSGLYWMVHHQMSRFENLAHFPQPDQYDQLRRLLEVLPRPTSEHGSKLVCVHGDFSSHSSSLLTLILAGTHSRCPHLSSLLTHPRCRRCTLCESGVAR